MSQENPDMVFHQLEKRIRIIADPALIVELDRVCEFRSKEDLPYAINWIKSVINKTKEKTK